MQKDMIHRHIKISIFMRRVNKIEVLKQKQQQVVLLLFLGLFFALPFNDINAQVKGWEKRYGDEVVGLDDGHTVIQTADQGFALLGTDNQEKILLVKTDPNGYVQWSETFNESLIAFTGADMVQDDDGTYVVVGSCFGCAEDGGGGEDIVVLRIDENGNKIDQGAFGFGAEDKASAIIKTQDCGFMITGYSILGVGNKQISFVKLDANLDLEFEKLYGGEDNEEGVDIIENDLGEFVAVGVLEESGDEDVYIFSINVAGDSIWHQSFGNSLFNKANSITFDKDINGNNIGSVSYTHLTLPTICSV